MRHPFYFKLNNWYIILSTKRGKSQGIMINIVTIKISCLPYQESYMYAEFISYTRTNQGRRPMIFHSAISAISVDLLEK
jgi:hypothetical protein